MKHVLIIGGRQGIGGELARLYLSENTKLTITSSDKNFCAENINSNKNMCHIYYLDITSKLSNQEFIKDLRNSSRLNFDIIIITIGTLKPIGALKNLDFDDLKSSFNLNFFSPLEFTKNLIFNLPVNSESTFIYFGGGGINNAFTNHLAYSVSKIALQKSLEILHEEYQNHNFVCIGPGYVKTSIHEETIRVGENVSGQNYKKVLNLLKTNGTPISDIKNCIDWCHDAGRNVVGGRNVSVVHDEWGSSQLTKNLTEDFNLWKLRRKNLNEDL